MAHAFSSLDELGSGPGIRKVRRELGIESFGANVFVFPPRFEGFAHYHDEQDELYFVHSGRALFEVDGETRELGPGGFCHVSAQTPRKFSNAGDDELVVLIVGGRGGYVGRDGHLVDPEHDLERRKAFGTP